MLHRMHITCDAYLMKNLKVQVILQDYEGD